MRVEVDRDALVRVLIVGRHDLFADECRYNSNDSCIKDAMQFLANNGIELTEDEYIRAMAFPYGDLHDYNHVAELIGFDGDWRKVIEAQLKDVVAIAEEGGDQNYGEQIAGVLFRAKKLGITINPWSEAVRRAVASCYYAMKDQGWDINPTCAEQLESDLDNWGWTAERVALAAGEFPPIG